MEGGLWACDLVELVHRTVGQVSALTGTNRDATKTDVVIVELLCLRLWWRGDVVHGEGLLDSGDIVGRVRGLKRSRTTQGHGSWQRSVVVLWTFLEGDTKRVALRLAAREFGRTIGRRAADVAQDWTIHARVGVRHGMMTRAEARAETPVSVRCLRVCEIESS